MILYLQLTQVQQAAACSQIFFQDQNIQSLTTNIRVVYRRVGSPHIPITICILRNFRKMVVAKEVLIAQSLQTMTILTVRLMKLWTKVQCYAIEMTYLDMFQ